MDKIISRTDFTVLFKKQTSPDPPGKECLLFRNAICPAPAQKKSGRELIKSSNLLYSRASSNTDFPRPHLLLRTAQNHLYI
jgi:hypothetical protein